MRIIYTVMKHGFELLFEKGEEVFRVQEGSNQYVITLKISEEIATDYSYQLLAFKSSLDESLVELVQYTNENNFQILQRDAILVDTSEEKVKVYELEIEIKNENLRKVGTLHLSISNPEDINTYQTKFIDYFDEFDKKE